MRPCESPYFCIVMFEDVPVFPIPFFPRERPFSMTFCCIFHITYTVWKNLVDLYYW